MNQKKAKLLRRTAGFDVHAEREYEERVRKQDKDGKPSSVQLFNVGPRAVYQNLKKGAK